MPGRADSPTTCFQSKYSCVASLSSADSSSSSGCSRGGMGPPLPAPSELSFEAVLVVEGFGAEVDEDAVSACVPVTS